MARTPDKEVDQPIHKATVELLATVGYDAVTFQAVAERAGVARTTVYRRYGDLASLVVGAVDGVLGLSQPVEAPPSPPAGTEQWRQLVRSLRAALIDSAMGLQMLAALMLAEHRHPRLIALWRTQVIEPRIRKIAAVWGLPFETARLLGELAFGGIIARYIARGDVTEQDADEIASTLQDHPLFRL